MSIPTVSFVVMSYNHCAFIGDCIAGILQQDEAIDVEIIVVDDCSQDGTEERVRSFDDKRIVFVRHEKNTGHVQTAHDGFARVRGRFVARVDADDRHLPSFLARTVPLLEKNGDVVAVYGNSRMIDPLGELTSEFDQKTSELHGGRDRKWSAFLPLLERNFICAPTLIARREAWLETLPIPGHLAFSDWWCSLIMARRGDFCYVDEPLADYRVHPGNSHVSTAADGSEESSVLWVLDHIFAQAELAEWPEPKVTARNRVLACHYREFGRKYFGFRNARAARRCLARAFSLDPLAFDAASLRYLVASCVPRPGYEAFKKLIR